MKNSNKPKDDQVQDEIPVKKKDNSVLKDHGPAVSNSVTDTVKNTASVTDGLNQQQSDNNELEPGTHK